VSIRDRVDDTNVTLTLGGTPGSSVLAATSLTLGWTGQLGMDRGGTNASLTAADGGILYSTASAAAILAPTATAGQLLLSGANGAPSWSPFAMPVTDGTANQILQTDGSGSVTWVNAPATGVTSLTGTVNQVNVSASTGAVTLSTPQDIDTLATVEFTSADLGTTTLLASRALTVDTGGGFDVNMGTASGDDFSVDTSTLVVEGDTGHVGIGTTAPLYQVHNLVAVDASGFEYGMLNRIDVTPTANSVQTIIGERSDVQTAATAFDIGALYGSAPRIFHFGTGTVTDARGLNLVARNRSTGTITTATGAFFQAIQDNTAGTITTAVGGEFQALNLGIGTVTTAKGGNFTAQGTTAYGVYINPSVGTTAYGLYQEGASDLNFFEGDVSVPTLISTVAVRLTSYTVAGLPAGTQGDTAFVTDATTPTYLAAVVGGGSVVTPVFYNGTAWVAH